MFSIHKVKELLAKMKVSAFVIYFLGNFEPKPLATKLVKKTCDMVNANRPYINANGKWPNFIMKNCQNV